METRHPGIQLPPRRTFRSWLFDRRRSDGRGTLFFLFRRVSGKRAVTVIGTVLGIAGVTAWERLNNHEGPRERPATQVESTLTALGGRTASLERFRDSVSAWRVSQRMLDDSARTERTMQTYMLCMLTRETLPVATPAGCAPIEAAARRRR